MGKRYYCDYCDKTMTCSPSIIRTHNNGLVHQKNVQEHYQRFKDPETILSEESTKKPCSRVVNGECHFGAMCRFSHYTREQLESLRQYVSTKKLADEVESTIPCFQDLYNQLSKEKLKPTTEENTIIMDPYGMTHEFPWSYNANFESYCDNLPISLRKFKIEDFYNINFSEWG